MDRDLGTAVPEERGSATVGGSARSLRRERTLILALLLILAAASWAILIWQSRTANGMGMGATLFLVFAQVQRDHHSSERAFILTWVFVGAYLLIWTLFGVLVYLGAVATSGLAQHRFPGS